MAVSSARHQKELEFALERLGGGLRHPVEELRSDLLNLLADLKQPTRFCRRRHQFCRFARFAVSLASGMAKLRNLKRRWRSATQERATAGRLVWATQRRESTQFNKLMESSGEVKALVSNLPRTTRDWLVGKGRFPAGWKSIGLIPPGWVRESVDDLDRMAQSQTLHLLPRVDLIVLCLAPGQVPFPPHPEWREIPILRVSTRVDETPGGPQDRLAVYVLHRARPGHFGGKPWNNSCTKWGRTACLRWLAVRPT